MRHSAKMNKRDRQFARDMEGCPRQMSMSPVNTRGVDYFHNMDSYSFTVLKLVLQRTATFYLTYCNKIFF